MADTTNCIFLDFETRSQIDIDVGAAAYAAHPSTELLLTGYCIEDGQAISTQATDPKSLELTPLFESMNDGYLVVCHNMLFEIFVWKYVARKLGWPVSRLNQWRCTMQMAGRAGLPHDLDGAAKSLKLDPKLEVGKLLIHLFSKPKPDGTFNDMNDPKFHRETANFKKYNAADTDVSREIWRNLPAFKPTEESDVLLDLRANLHGVPIDTHASKNIYRNVLAEQDEFSNRVTKLTNGVITKMTQAKRIKDWINSHSELELENCQAETIVDILDNHTDKLDDTCIQILEMRQHSGKASTGKYKRLSEGAVDDMIQGMIISFGAHTHRTISKLLNLNNLPKPSVKYESMGELVEDLANMSRLEINHKYGSYLRAASTSIRGMIKAPPGKTLAVADYNAIEARIVLWAAGSEIGLQKYRENLDLYVEMASVIFNVSPADVTEDMRWVGKNCILGAGFGLGWKGFRNTCLNYGRRIPDSLCKSTIGAYRELFNEVPEAWEATERAAMRACRTGKVTTALNGLIAFKTFKTKSGVPFLLMRKPNGTFMMYPHVKLVMATTPWGERKKVIGYRKVINGRWGHETTYGGSLYENWVQSVARDIMYCGAKNAQSNGYQQLFAVYDEAVTLIDEDKANISEFEKFLCEVDDCYNGLPLKAEGKLLRWYQKI